ncbi:zinc finger protein ZFPM1-like [Mus pahari]|uniref:zinc finger protein ZFPM1-like n=1 Tax=Mus pahari TaxID=10093 RepID=UPI000A30926D|nr:zinc finger protein ZFPM1-like [Mus pahari]
MAGRGVRAGGDNGPERAPPGPPWADRQSPAFGRASPRGWPASATARAPGLSSAVPSPCRAPGLQEELEPGCSTTPRPGTRRPGAGSAGQVTCIGPGWGLREARGRPFPDFCPRGGLHRGRKPRWAWSAGAGEKLQCDQFHQAPPERPARRDTGTLSPSSLNPPGPLLPHVSPIRRPSCSQPWLARAPLSPWQGLLGTCWPRRPALSLVLPAAPQPLARGRQAGCRELAAPSRKLQSICNALSLIGSSELNFNKAFVSSRLIVKASIRPGR